MATKRPLVLSSSGEPQVLKSGDVVGVDAGGTGVTSLAALKTAMGLDGGGGGSSATYVDVDVDFGAIPIHSKTIDVTDASALTTSRVFCSIRPDSDEYEMDTIHCSGYCQVNGTVRLIVSGIPGPISGIRKITYWLG